MPLSDIILGANEVLITDSASGLGVMPIDNNIAFGVIQAVSDVTDRFTVGNSVMFDPTKTRRFVYGSTVYRIANEENISGTETIVP